MEALGLYSIGLTLGYLLAGNKESTYHAAKRPDTRRWGRLRQHAPSLVTPERERLQLINYNITAVDGHMLFLQHRTDNTRLVLTPRLRSDRWHFRSPVGEREIDENLGEATQALVVFYGNTPWEITDVVDIPIRDSDPVTHIITDNDIKFFVKSPTTGAYGDIRVVNHPNYEVAPNPQRLGYLL